MKIIALLLSLLFALPAGAGCLKDAGTIAESLNCLGLPTIPKFSDPNTFEWKGKEILAVSNGNEIRLWDISTPSHPIAFATSNFNVPHQGDSDHDLLNYSICDDCRFGIATYKLGTVLWDLGTGPRPMFGSRKFYRNGAQSVGGFAYKAGGQDFVIAYGLPEDCKKEGTVYSLTSPSAITKTGCVDVPGWLRITNGKRTAGGFYLGFNNNSVHLFRWADPLGLYYVAATPIRGSLGWTKGIDLDGTSLLSGWVTGGAKLWDVTQAESPVPISTIPGSYTNVALAPRWAFLSRSAESTFDISDPANPVPLDQQFWDPSHPWNNYAAGCTFPAGATFSRDGSTLYYARYSVVHQVDFSGCGGSIPTPTPTPPPWPTPMPTCVPGCLSVDPPSQPE